jgi:hypothetical protein
MSAERDAYAAAPIGESFGEYRDTFDRYNSRVSVELCHGTWHTFARVYRDVGDPGVRAHASREAARVFARAWLAR